MSAGTIEVEIVAEDVFEVKSETRKISVTVSKYSHCYFLPITLIRNWQRLKSAKKFYVWNLHLHLYLRCSNSH